MFLCQNFIPTIIFNLFDTKTSLVYIPINLAYQDLQDLTPLNVTSYIYKF